MNKKVLGKGLGALLPSQEDCNQDNNGVVEININDIEPNVNQPRQVFDKDKLDDLAQSIKQYGIVQPLIVKNEDNVYKIIAGERRWRAARLAGLKTVPCIVRDYTNAQMMQVALIENLQRQDLNPIEEAEAFDKLINEHGITQENLAVIVGKSRPAITNSLRLLNLPDKVKDMVISGQISSGHARALLALKEKGDIEKIAELIVEKELSVRQVESLVNKLSNENNCMQKKSNDLDSEYKQACIEIEEKIKNILGTKVVLKAGKNKGKIMIEYYSDEELERLMSFFEKAANTIL